MFLENLEELTAWQAFGAQAARKLMSVRDIICDEAIVLQVKNWQDTDKYASCFSREHGRLNFVAYGARYAKNVQGRLLQPFASLAVEVQQGQKLDRLRSCELLEMPRTYDVLQVAYASVVSELTVLFTEERQPQQELYELLKSTLAAIALRNPRLVVLSFAVKLLALAGVSPQLDACVNCGKVLTDAETFRFSYLQGGLLCSSCSCLGGAGEQDDFSLNLKALWNWLLILDYVNPQTFKVMGSDLMQLEKALLSFIMFQTEKPLQSLNFLQQLEA